jgi:hypothetical protein
MATTCGAPGKGFPQLPKRVGRNVTEIELEVPHVEPPPLADLLFFGSDTNADMTQEQYRHMYRVTGHKDIALRD